jgi:hypothetical protein
MRALIELGKARGYVTFDELLEELPDEVDESDWITALEAQGIDVVPHGSLRSGDVDSPGEPYFITEVEVAIDRATARGLLYWAPYVTWGDHAVDRFVLALLAVKVGRAQRRFADRAARHGYQVSKLESGLAIDLRAMPSARLEIGIDGYAADRGSFAAIAPTRVQLARAARVEREEVMYAIADAGTAVLPLQLTAPLFVGTTPHGEVEVEAACTIESRDWGLKWLDVAPLRCASPASLDPVTVTASGATVEDGSLSMRGAQGCHLAIELVQDGHALRFVATGLHVRAARRPRRERQVVSVRSSISHEPRPIEYELVGPALPTDPHPVISLLRDTEDPAIAASLVTRLLDGPHEPVLRACIEDPTEDPHVVINALWCLWRRGEVHTELLANLLERAPPAQVVEQVARVALSSMADARSWLQQFEAPEIDQVLAEWDRRNL